jgi:hypothetical protein
MVAYPLRSRFAVRCIRARRNSRRNAFALPVLMRAFSPPYCRVCIANPLSSPFSSLFLHAHPAALTDGVATLNKKPFGGHSTIGDVRSHSSILSLCAAYGVGLLQHQALCSHPPFPATGHTGLPDQRNRPPPPPPPPLLLLPPRLLAPGRFVAPPGPPPSPPHTSCALCLPLSLSLSLSLSLHTHTHAHTHICVPALQLLAQLAVKTKGWPVPLTTPVLRADAGAEPPTLSKEERKAQRAALFSQIDTDARHPPTPYPSPPPPPWHP